MRSFNEPTGLTWLDLPVQLESPPGPTVEFETRTPTICAVSRLGELRTPGQYDGRRGTCRISVTADGDDRWLPLDDELVIELGGPPVVARLASTPSTDLDWFGTEITIPLTLEIRTNPGWASVYAESGSGQPCRAETTAESPVQIDFTITITEAGRCTVTFVTFSSGVFDYDEDLPSPLVFVASAPATTTTATTTG
ncbi:MAG: hypothetical protein AAGA99_19555 [Actinomycetota bacterium]